MNIILPTLLAKQDAATVLIDSLQTIETARALLGPAALNTIIKNNEFIDEVVRAVGIVQRFRPILSHEKVRSRGTALDHPTFMVRDARRFNFQKQSLDVRLSGFKERKVSRIRDTIDRIFSIERTDRDNIKLIYPEPGGVQESPRATIGRRKGYRDRWYYSYDIAVDNRWLISRAYEVAKAFNWKFFPLECNALAFQQEAGLTCYSVTRLRPNIQPYVNCSFFDPEQGFAFHDASGATGWGDTQESAYTNLRKARAKIARKRLLQTFKA